MEKSRAQKINQEYLKFTDYLKESGLKLSKAREVIFNKVMGMHGHFTAEELTKECLEKHLAVSRPTVFRVLHDLLEAGIIRETAFGDKHRHFEHIYDEKLHHHAQCVRCHKFIEFPDKKEDRVYHSFLEKQGFKILGHEMHFYGICHKCTLKTGTPASRKES